MPLPVCETPELLLECDLAALVIRWRANVTRRLEVKFSYGGARAFLVLEPETAIPLVNLRDAPTECERDIVETIRSAGRRLTQPEVIEALAKANKIHGDSTIVKALARMVKDGRLTQVKRRGYGIAEVKAA